EQAGELLIGHFSLGGSDLDGGQVARDPLHHLLFLDRLFPRCAKGLRALRLGSGRLGPQLLEAWNRAFGDDLERRRLLVERLFQRGTGRGLSLRGRFRAGGIKWAPSHGHKEDKAEDKQAEKAAVHPWLLSHCYATADRCW